MEQIGTICLAPKRWVSEKCLLWSDMYTVYIYIYVIFLDVLFDLSLKGKHDLVAFWNEII